MNNISKFFLILLICILSISSVFADKSIDLNPPAKLDSNWQYRFGDCDTDNSGIPVWVYDEWENANWKEFKVPGQPDNKSKDYKSTWLRVKLPQDTFRDPSVFFKTNDQRFQVFLDNKLIYQYGDLSINGEKKAPGSPWHLIILPNDYQGKVLSFRMHTIFKTNAGLVREAVIGTQKDQILNIIYSGWDNFVLAFLFGFLGFCLTLFFIARKDTSSPYLSLAISSFFIGIWLISESDIKQLFIYNPILWLYLAIPSFYLVPVGIGSFVEQVFGGKYKKILRLLWQLDVFYTVLALILDLTGLLPIIFTLKYFYIIAVSMIIMILITTIKETIKGNSEGRIFCIGFMSFGLFAIYDILGWFFRIVPWSKLLSPWGIFIFILSLVLILVKRFIDLHNQLVDYSNEIAVSKDQLEELNKSLENKVTKRTESIKNLLDNAGQGFLTFGEDLIIDSQYSQECSYIFKDPIEGNKISHILYPNDKEQQNFIEKVLSKILDESEEEKSNLYFPLLPKEIKINSSYINIEYKVIDDIEKKDSKAFMIILTDITDKKLLENQMEHERNILKMVVKVVVNFNDFSECIKDFYSFCNIGASKILTSNQSIDNKIFEIFRTIHTFKGNFSQFDMANSVQKLHSFESTISNIRKNTGGITQEGLEILLSQSDISHWLDKDISLLKGILGNKFFERDNTLIVDKDLIVDLETKMVSLLSSFECKILLPYIRKLRFKSLNDLIRCYPDYIIKLSERLNKLVNPLNIDIHDIMIDADIYHEFIKSLVHIFRNILDHGIESPDERLLKGKSEYGNISIKAVQNRSQIKIEISDDGKGIDIDKIKQKSLTIGIYNSNQINTIKEDELLSLIFVDAFSTKDTVDEYSGRGMGLSAVLNEVQELGGQINIKTKKDTGTTFEFILPCVQLDFLKEIKVEDIMKPIVEKANSLMQNQFKLIPLQIEDFDMLEYNKLSLFEFSAFLEIKGVVQCKVILSMDKSLASCILRSFINEELDESEKGDYIEDALGECLNIIIGNSIKMFPGLEELIQIESPVTIHSGDTSIKYIESKIWSCHMEYQEGDLTLNIVS